MKSYPVKETTWPERDLGILRHASWSLREKRDRIRECEKFFMPYNGKRELVGFEEKSLLKAIK